LQQCLTNQTIEKIMKVYVVLEDDRGCGPSVAGVFATLEAAKAFVEENRGHYFLASEYGEEVRQ
jgi:hypothetical protein